MKDLIAENGIPIILMHSRGDSKTMDKLTEYKNDVIILNAKKELLSIKLENINKAKIKLKW